MKKILVVCDPKEKSVSLQQIPASLKHIFKAPEGESFISLDASQAEVRVFASLSQDPKMKAVFESGRDIYKEMASMIYGIPYDEVTPDVRSKVKTCTIAIQYNMRDNSLANRLGISVEEAAQVRAKYYETFSTAIAFRQKCMDYAMREGKSPTYFGRYRDFGGASKMDDEKAGEAFSTLIQGTQAELAKVAMIMIDKHFKDKGYGKIKLNLHDEILVQVPDEHIEEAKTELLDIMKKSYGLREDWCPFEFSVNHGKSWGEASKD